MKGTDDGPELRMPCRPPGMRAPPVYNCTATLYIDQFFLRCSRCGIPCPISGITRTVTASRLRSTVIPDQRHGRVLLSLARFDVRVR